MHLVKDKVIFNEFEHLTVFPKGTEYYPGYKILKTNGKESQYGINVVPVFLKRDSYVEKQAICYKYSKSYRRDDNDSFNDLQNKYYELKAKLLERKILNLYENVRIFFRKEHTLSLVFDEESFAHNLLEYEGKLTKVNFFQDPSTDKILFTYNVLLTNLMPVICEKHLGEDSYPYLGLSLEPEDAIFYERVREMRRRK